MMVFEGWKRNVREKMKEEMNKQAKKQNGTCEHNEKEI